MSNKDYVGRLDPISETWKRDPWTKLLIERYQLSQKFCEGKKVLDTCCGTGWGTVSYIVPIADCVTGFDLAAPMPQLKYNTEKCKFLTMDATKIELEQKNYDIALALDSIEHLKREDGLKYINGMKQHLKKNGVLFGTTPLVERDSLIPVFLKWNKYHLYMYTELKLYESLKKSFEFVKIYRIYNEVCPYFAFACCDSQPQLKEFDDKINHFLVENKHRFEKGKITAYRLWSKYLLRRGDLIESLKYLLLSFRQ